MLVRHVSLRESYMLLGTTHSDIGVARVAGLAISWMLDL